MTRRCPNDSRRIQHVGGWTMSGFREWARAGWRSLIAVALVIGFVLPLGAAPDAVAQAELPLTAEAAPADTALFISLDLDLNGEQWQQTEALLARVGLPQALDMGQDAILEEGAEQGDFSEGDLNALLGGEMAFAVTPAAIEQLTAMMAMMAMSYEGMGQEGMDHEAMAAATPMAEAMAGPLGLAAIIVPGDPDAAWDYVNRQIASLAVEMQAPVRETTYSGADLLVVEPPDMGMHHGGGDDAADKWMSDMGMHGPPGFATARADEF